MRTVESIAEVGRDDSGPWLQVESAPDGLTRSRRKLQEIVRRAYQRPLGGNLADPSQQEDRGSGLTMDSAEKVFCQK